MRKLTLISKILLIVACLLGIGKMIFFVVSSNSEEKIENYIMSLQSTITKVNQELKNSTLSVDIGGVKNISLVTEREIDSTQKNGTYPNTNVAQSTLVMSKCFLTYSNSNLEFQKELDAKCLEYGLSPETVRPEIVSILQEKRNYTESIRATREEYTSYYYHPLVLPFSQDNFYGFRIYGIIFYMFIVVFLIEVIHWFYIKKSKLID